jgi:eukaryotic-like serine/threonine-protein kinase
MNHSTEVFLRIEAIFNEALDAPSEVRPALIAERCDGDEVLMAEVKSLLRASDAEEHLTASRRREPGVGIDNGIDAEIPLEQRRIGPYQLDRLLGRGGMGAVYLAHRVDGQFEQQVAVKLIDLPLATDFFRERFRMERQILAGLQHPFIARLLDGGVSADGDLYLAMEYVDGVPIHRYCETTGLTIAERLELFLSVCEAVQFAHQNLVVHRDLKPDNILVAVDGTPRLLDFGTAKLVSPSREKEEGDLTRQGFQSFTPQYASPEQVLGQPITTATDTYSLGVLLYLLLTGSLPYELKELTTGEMLRVICEEPPRKPVSGVGSKNRLDADLEAILEKALRKEPQQRYRTAEQLASDVRDFLDGRPVAARRGTFRYLAAKFIRRNRVGIAAAALLALTLAAGIVGVVWQARLANVQRRRAEARAADLRQLSNSLLSELDEAIKQIPGSTGAQKLLVTRVLEHLDRMTKDAEGDRQSELDLVDAYTRLGNVQGNVYDQNLGDPAGALASLGKAIAIAEPLTRSDANDREALQSLATAQEDRGEVLGGLGRVVESVAMLKASVATYDKLLALPGAAPAMFLEAATVNDTLADEVGEDSGLADLPTAMVYYRTAMDLDILAAKQDPKYVPAQKAVAHMQFKIGNAELDFDQAQALRDLRISLVSLDALPEAERAKLPTVRLRGLTLRKEAVALTEMEQFDQAWPLFDQSQVIFERIAAADSSDTKDIRALGDMKRLFFDVASGYDWAADVRSIGAPQSASEARRRYLQKAAETWQKEIDAAQLMLKHDKAHEDWVVDRAYAQARVASLKQLLHEGGNASVTLKPALAELKTFADRKDASSRNLYMAATAELMAEPQSVRDPRQALEWAERGTALTHRKESEWLLTLAQAYRATGQPGKARAAAEEGLKLLPQVQSGDTKSRDRRQLEMEARGSASS